MFGRCHIIRVLLGSVVFVLTCLIIYENFYADKFPSGIIQLPDGMIQETWMTLEEFTALSRPNKTCPVCFGRSACDEIISGIAKNQIGISRIPFHYGDDTEDLVVHQVYGVKTGKVRYWLQPLQHSHAMMSRFEEFVCRNGSANQKQLANCNLSHASKTSFLYTSTLELSNIINLYKAHLITPRRIPMTVCPTYKLIRGLVSTFDEDSDLTLTAEEKAILLTTVATNPDLAIQRFVLNQKLQFPVLPFFGTCGRVSFIQGPHKPLSSYLQESLPVRLDLASQVLQLIDSFLHDDPEWMLFTVDISLKNFVVTQDEQQVFLRDLSGGILLDRDLIQDVNSDEASVKEANECDIKCFNNFYDKLTGRQQENKNSTLKWDSNLSQIYSDCGLLSSMAGHMFGFACKSVILGSDDDSSTGQKGLLHSLDTSKTDAQINIKDLQSLLAQCSEGQSAQVQMSAAMKIIALVSGENVDEDSDADFNDSNSSNENDRQAGEKDIKIVDENNLV